MNKKLTISTPYITTYPPYANIFSMIGRCKDSMNILSLILILELTK